MVRGSSKYLQIAIYVLLSFIFVIVIGVVKDCSRLPSVAIEGFSSGDTLDIALIYGPDSYYVSEDTMAGINHEIAALYELQTGIPLKLWPITDPLNGLKKLESGAYDIVASLPLDNTIKNQYSVSESVFLDRLVLIQLNDSISGIKTVNSSLDLNSRKVYVAAGSSAVNRLKNLAEEIGGKIDIEESPDMSDELLCLQVATGTIPLAVVNERVAQSIAENYPRLSYDSSVSFTQFQVWVFNKTDTIEQQRFNSWLKDFKSTEAYQIILNKY